MKRLWLVVALACALSLWQSSGASAAVAVQPPAGTFKMQPELKGKHPRLYFTKEDIPEIRRLALGPRQFFLERTKASFGYLVGQDVPAGELGWKQYLYGYWGLFGMDMLYVVEGDQKYADTAKKWAMWLVKDHWWVRDDLAPMDALSGLSVTYDVLYDQFSEEERQAIRQSIFEGVQYISKRFFRDDYWTQDCQNNHMHNRIHGLANGSFAIYGDDPSMDVQPYADLAIAMIHNVVKWLPEDGSQHEGPGYWNFGHNWVVRMVHLAEHVTGEDIASQNTHFSNSHYFRIYMTAPGFNTSFNIGDGSTDLGDTLTTVCRSIAEAKDPYGTAVLQRWMEDDAQSFYRYPPWGLLWYDYTIRPKPIAEMPLYRFWPDLEMFSIRGSWQDDAVGLVFKCGPPGGHKMQKLRGENWVNVAHDHPDQNHFLLFAYGKMMAEDDGYPDPKLTRSHNTIVVDGKGQRREGEAWQQPFPYEQTGHMKDLFLCGDTAYTAGDASRLYEGTQKFVRHLAFVGGQYVIVMDDLVGAGGTEHAFEWRLHKDGTWSQPGPGRFAVADGDVTLDVAFLAPRADQLESQFLPAEKTAKPCVAVTSRGQSLRFLTVLVPKKGGSPDITAEQLQAAGCTAVRTSGPEHRDLFGVGDNPGPFTFGDVQADAAAALVRLRGSEPSSVLLVRGTSLRLGGKLLAGASAPANVSWSRTAAGVAAAAEPPYGSEAVTTVLSLGGLGPGKNYTLLVDGQARGSVQADADGVVQASVDLSARRKVQVGQGG
jgi:hypothetical protein